jgi:hypothetical protein
LPLKFGFLFSANAVNPSIMSSVEKIGWPISSSFSKASASV